MNVKRLLGKGYFPKELPPAFTTQAFAEKSQYIQTKWSAVWQFENTKHARETGAIKKVRLNEFKSIYGSSKCASLSYPKSLVSRRKLEIPNPTNFHELCICIVKNWKLLRETQLQTKYSYSSPIEAESSRSVRTKSRSLNDFKFELIRKSSDKRFELRLDIAQYYPKIYTHSIPWAILGKSKAKEYNSLKNKPGWDVILLNDENARNFAVADKLDTLIRSCQERQSVSIPIGPDSSFILAEIIGNRIDIELENELEGIDFECVRYYDDYYFYTHSFGDAEIILKAAQKILLEFQLETNESKVLIKKLPFSFEPKWVFKISGYHFSQINKFTIREYFFLLYSLCEDFPAESSSIISYGLLRFEFGNIQIPKIEWELFLELLLKLLQIDPGNIDQVFKILLSYEVLLDRKSKIKVQAVLERLISEQLRLNHSFEVLWSLWILKSFKLKCKSAVLEEVIGSSDYQSILICLDLISQKLYSGEKPSIISVSDSMSSNDLHTEKWLFVYESIRQSWVNANHSIVTEHRYFKILFDYNIKFYDPSKQIEVSFNYEPNRPLTPDKSALGELLANNSGSGKVKRTRKISISDRY